MIRWNRHYFRLLIVLGAIAAFLVASGAGSRWSG